jgi:hypothetical protein
MLLFKNETIQAPAFVPDKNEIEILPLTNRSDLSVSVRFIFNEYGIWSHESEQFMPLTAPAMTLRKWQKLLKKVQSQFVTYSLFKCS